MLDYIVPTVTPCCGQPAAAEIHALDKKEDTPWCVCPRCGEWLIYTDERTLRILTLDERKNLPPEVLCSMIPKRETLKVKLQPGYGKSP